jgi:signal peptide peptidase SppA
MDQHFGLWAVELTWFRSAVAALNAGKIQPTRAYWTNGRGEPDAELQPEDVGAVGADGEKRRIFALDHAGIALIDITGHMMKGSTKYGGASTIWARRQIRAAAADPEVKGIMLAIDSPGGTVAGTDELAGDVRQAGKEKPVHAHIDDLGASAAYWIAAQTYKITASKTSEVGSIGTVAVIQDLSGAAEKEGIEVHVISTGAYKGLGAPGSKVTDEHLGEIRRRVDGMNEHFLTAVAAGRGIPREVSDKWATGQMWLAEEAAKMGLIDEVMPFDQAMSDLRQLVNPPQHTGVSDTSRAIALARASIRQRQLAAEVYAKNSNPPRGS